VHINQTMWWILSYNFDNTSMSDRCKPYILHNEVNIYHTGGYFHYKTCIKCTKHYQQKYGVILFISLWTTYISFPYIRKDKRHPLSRRNVVYAFRTLARNKMALLAYPIFLKYIFFDTKSWHFIERMLNSKIVFLNPMI